MGEGLIGAGGDDTVRRSNGKPASWRFLVAQCRGSGTVLAVGIIAAILILAGALLVALIAHAVHTRASVAADAAALAAANTASGRIRGDPCANAAAVAVAHEAQLTKCDSSFAETTVEVMTSAGVLQFTAHARAGLPPDTLARSSVRPSG